MALPDSYTQKPGSIPEYFNAILNAEAPDRFTYRFLEKLEFKSTNDRLFLGILKDLRFLDADGVPQQRYYQFHDKTQSRKVLAEAIREAYSDLFEINKEADKFTAEQAKNKLRTLYQGSKKDTVIGKIARTFNALCDYADFSTKKKEVEKKKEEKTPSNKKANEEISEKYKIPPLAMDSLQYHINIVLPESRDQAVYDAIFKSLRDHLGEKNG